MVIKLQTAEPSPCFEQYIRCYKYIESDLSGLMKSVPVAEEELYFNFTHVRLLSQGRFNLDNPRIHLAGLAEYDQDCYSYAYGSDRGGGFAIVFKPQGFYHLFNIKSKDFCRYAVNGDSIFKTDILDLWESLQIFHNVYDMKNLVESRLIKYVRPDKQELNIIRNIFNYMAGSNGMVRISQICKHFNISEKTLQRKFKEDIGLSPKEMLQILRINKAISLMNSKKENDFSKISYLSGYYDQSHFIKDLKRITGMTPGRFNGKDNPDKILCADRIFIKSD